MVGEVLTFKQDLMKHPYSNEGDINHVNKQIKRCANFMFLSNLLIRVLDQESLLKEEQN